MGLTFLTSKKWISSFEALELLRKRFEACEEQLDSRVLGKLQIGAIRCQVNYAAIKIGGVSKATPLPWSVPKWIWQLHGAKFALSEDKYLNQNSEHPHGAVPSDFSGIELVHLEGLKLHPQEFCKVFDIIIPIKYQKEIIKNKSKSNKVAKHIQLSRCISWLKLEFENDKERGMRKENFWKLAKKKKEFGHLHERTFLKAWDIAVISSPERSRPGRPKGT